MAASSMAPVQIFTGRRLHTMADPPAASPQDRAFATVGEKILAVGSPEALVEGFPGAQLTDFGPATIIPGLNDAHMHPSFAAEDWFNVDLSPHHVPTRAQLLSVLAARAASTPAGDWVLGSRYDHVKTTAGDVIDRHDLDGVSRDHPIMITQIAGHWAVANSVALTRAGLDDTSVPPSGGDYGRDGAGHLNGVLFERAMEPFRTGLVPAPGLDDVVTGLEQVSRTFHAAGLTSVGDAAVTPAGMRLFSEAERQGRLSLRVNMLLRYEYFDHARQVGLTTGFGGDRLRLGGIKLTLDGAVAGRTCWMDEPFEDAEEDHGIQVMSAGEVNDIVLAVHTSGSRVAGHANGDRAIRMLLDAVEAARAVDPRTDLEHRIEHCTLIDDGIIDRIGRLGMQAVPFGSYVNFHGEKLLGWYGERRLERMFAHRTLLDAGIPVAGSSDYGAGPFEPLLALQSCVTRQSADGTLLGGSQRISAAEALALYTVGSAHASGEDHVKGRLAPGYLADFTVLDEDPLEVDPRRIGSLGVRSTWVGANCVWAAE